jgi:hypothetical protein
MQGSKQEVFALLETEGFSSQSRYEEASNCAGFLAIVPITGERKQLFAEYLNFIRAKERDTRRKLLSQARLDFQQALRAFISFENFHSLTFSQIADRFHSAPFWKLIDEAELDDIYQSAMDDFESTLSEPDLIDLFANDERFNFRTPFTEILIFFPNYPKLFVLRNWRNFFHLCENAEKERRRQNILLKEKKARNAFREILKKNPEPGKSWPEFQGKIKNLECYITLIGSKGSQPYDLFLACSPDP